MVTFLVERQKIGRQWFGIPRLGNRLTNGGVVRPSKLYYPRRVTTINTKREGVTISNRADLA